MEATHFKTRAVDLTRLIARRSGSAFGTTVQISPEDDYQVTGLEGPEEVINILNALENDGIITIVAAGAKPSVSITDYGRWSVKLLRRGYDFIGLQR